MWLIKKLFAHALAKNAVTTKLGVTLLSMIATAFIPIGYSFMFGLQSSRAYYYLPIAATMYTSVTVLYWWGEQLFRNWDCRLWKSLLIGLLSGLSGGVLSMFIGDRILTGSFERVLNFSGSISNSLLAILLYSLMSGGLIYGLVLATLNCFTLLFSQRLNNSSAS